jgi:4-carboxymuconolactone decarboxylase
MARIPAVTRESLSPEDQKHFDYVAGSRGEVRGPFLILLNSPDVAERIAHVGTYIRFENTLKPALRELAILTVARTWNCQYEWTAHQPLAEGEGARPEAIAAIRDKTAPAGLEEDEAMVFNYVSALVGKGRVPDDVFQNAADKLGTRSITDLTATAGYYSMLACALNAAQAMPEEGKTPLLPNAEY